LYPEGKSHLNRKLTGQVVIDGKKIGKEKTTSKGKQEGRERKDFPTLIRNPGAKKTCYRVKGKETKKKGGETVKVRDAGEVQRRIEKGSGLEG